LPRLLFLLDQLINLVEFLEQIDADASEHFLLSDFKRLGVTLPTTDLLKKKKYDYKLIVELRE
jgi:hypothetical protein